MMPKLRQAKELFHAQAAPDFSEVSVLVVWKLSSSAVIQLEGSEGDQTGLKQVLSQPTVWSFNAL